MYVSCLFSFLTFRAVLCVALLKIVCCLYEDQAGKFDWRQQYIGKVKFAYVDPVSAGTHKFTVSTEKNVLACLSTRTGSIIWRQVLEKGSAGEINAMSEEGDIITINGGGQFIRSWDSNTGVLQWETSFPHIQQNNAHLYFKIDSTSKEVVKIEMIPSQYTKVSIYSFTRASMKTSEDISSPWYDQSINCIFVSTSYFVCVDKEKRLIHLLSVKDGGSFISVPFTSLVIDIRNSINAVKVIALPYQESSDTPVFGLNIDDNVMLLQIQAPVIKMIKVLPSVTKITSTLVDNKLIIFSLKLKDKLYEFEAIDVGSKEELKNLAGVFTLSEDRGNLEDFYIFPYTKKDHGISYKSLLLFEDHSMLIIHQQGRMVWSREEALSSIISSEIMDLPLSETDANIEQEFGDPDAGLLSMFLTRLKSQVFLLQTFLLKTLIGLKGDIDNDGNAKKALSRDTFGLHKIIVILTKPGKIFGIDNFSGLIIWSHFERNLLPFTVKEKTYLPLFVQRTTAHFPYPPICTALGLHSVTGQNRLYSFDPITGSTLESKTLPYRILQVIPTGSLTNYLREILILDSDLKVHIYPESHDIKKHKDSHFIFTAEPKSGVLIGYSLSDSDVPNTLKATEIWKNTLPQPIVEVATKKLLEHVHSQGRVMGDRSVLYKYLNPNLAAVFTEGNDIIQKSFCNIYLIDVVTGLIIYSASHKRCKGPIHVVHSENWVVYSFYNDKSRRIEISSIELYEGMFQSNTTAFSSFAPPPLPLVEHQTFIFPSNIEVMADTVTERGMTSKHILIALPSGGILELPKNFLDPRRPINPLPEHREEGLIPYIPELPVVSESIINYNQSVVRVQGIVTAPSGLESTCLLFVYGLDLFYTRVTPSKTFDILKDDFDHSFICVVLLGLLVISYISKRFAARRTLRAAWK
ncbi:ER membrane protein complex subunit 1-like [Uloborus diversus]|uniref:ER membrane protein complex subunit 1-like n=1 Tax=Uloborus diversus TaxID=327109 RepID=UPI00240A0EBA|nr:ER membrane protein complex subunit 1-like [Uloborus diversus]